MRSGLALTVAALAALVLVAATARADGDPASDVLYFQDVYLPYPEPSKAAADALKAAVRTAFESHYRVTVAVIASPTDLGSVPSLFNKPDQYARFLGTELSSFYTEPLLVVMPAGFALYRNGADTSAEIRLLADVPLKSGSTDELTRSAAAAVLKLGGASGGSAQRGRDSSAPTVIALPATGTRGKAARLRYRVSDDSGRAREVVRVYGPAFFLFTTIVSPTERARAGTVDSVMWRVPTTAPARSVRFCVVASDPAGNLTAPSCAAVRIL